uniref:Xaa-Pro dipeptidyl-peptidase C-terminal domain-containing protein n=1 Tax=Chromera velia CCMP2878 TaxID=1169474 RepID=A0A0G4ID47_9ALVE|eukprot:Cvel_13261.t1-p1 / transcript=Cvel_13261.t1 / gene=Cvel_13261 / organism=Chromera_velia_CCMP2878 / gene_product=Putative serine esterase Mb1866c, putative / transcript_product=Putative serine esterase Mb1866c, putative / location=Cvel_scaffold899:33514-37307(+) / protein_length=996 / sequence_SO=supercontig / SO=protein_coding / is_pseudo=false
MRSRGQLQVPHPELLSSGAPKKQDTQGDAIRQSHMRFVGFASAFRLTMRAYFNAVGMASSKADWSLGSFLARTSFPEISEYLWGAGPIPIDLLDILALLYLFGVLGLAQYPKAKLQGLLCAVVVALAMWTGFLPHTWSTQARIERMPTDWFAGQAYVHAGMLVWSLLLDGYTLCMHLRGALSRSNRISSLVLAPLWGVFFFFGCVVLATRGHPPGTAGDFHWVNFKSLGSQIRHVPTLFPSRHSVYVPMRDGTKIAIDVYLPAETAAAHSSLIRERGAKPPSMKLSEETRAEVEKIPTFLHFTRYGRSLTLNWLFWFLPIFGEAPGRTWNQMTWHMAQPLLANGYAFVSVDVRGTGASFGHRESDLSHPEVEDLNEVVQWVRRQAWFNGKVASGGLSYDGMAGLQAAAQGGIDAVWVFFSPNDAFADVAAPGGVMNTAFVEEYQRFTSGLEKDGRLHPVLYKDPLVPLPYTVGIHSLISGVAPVGDRKALVRAAQREHQMNWDLQQVATSGRLRNADDLMTGPSGVSYRPDAGARLEVVEGLHRHNVSIYSTAGFFDSGSVRGAARMHAVLDGLDAQRPADEPRAARHLTLGPWTHSGRRNPSPLAPGSLSNWEKDAHKELVRWLDCELKGVCREGIDTESSVHFIMQEKVQKEEERKEEDECLTEVTENTCLLGEALMQPWTAPEVQSFERVHPGGDSTGKRGSWFASQSWPPAETEYSSLFFDFTDQTPLPTSTSWTGAKTDGVSFSLSPLPPSPTAPTSQDYTVNPESTTGKFTRWQLVHHVLRLSVDQGNRAAGQDQRNFVLTGTELTSDVRVAGSVWVSVWVDLVDGDDASIFAYLEDVDTTTGKVSMVTEGQVMASHRVAFSRPLGSSNPAALATLEDIHAETATRKSVKRGRRFEVQTETVATPGESSVFVRSFESVDRQPRSGVQRVDILLEPSAYTFHKGHAIRLAIAGADKGNFQAVLQEGSTLSTEWKILSGPSFPSAVHIPVLP